MVFQIGVANVFPCGIANVFPCGVAKVFQIGGQNWMSFTYLVTIK